MWPSTWGIFKKIVLILSTKLSIHFISFTVRPWQEDSGSITLLHFRSSFQSGRTVRCRLGEQVLEASPSGYWQCVSSFHGLVSYWRIARAFQWLVLFRTHGHSLLRPTIQQGCNYSPVQLDSTACCYLPTRCILIKEHHGHRCSLFHGKGCEDDWKPATLCVIDFSTVNTN